MSMPPPFNTRHAPNTAIIVGGMPYAVKPYGTDVGGDILSLLSLTGRGLWGGVAWRTVGEVEMDAHGAAPITWRIASADERQRGS